jgi:hypothetical protein
MPELLDRQPDQDRDSELVGPGRATLPAALPPAVETDELAARRSLRDQIARLERELADLFATTFPREGFEWDVRAPRRGPRLLPLAELERLRDNLAERLERNRRQLDERARLEERKRRTIEKMMLEPEAHKWALVSNDDIGERGCKHWQVQPRYGVLGLLCNWWRVRISSGCPLAGGRGPRS